MWVPRFVYLGFGIIIKKLDNGVFFLCFNQEKKENIMAKYLDQAGVQHLTEALVQNTKTIGGQSIWGSGNIETAESGNWITISTVGDFTTYKTQLESRIPKTVSIESGDYDLTDQTIIIRNATLVINSNVRLRNATSILFVECTTVYDTEPFLTAGVCLYIKAGRIGFNRCQITLRSNAFLENNINLSAEYIYINDSRLKIIPSTANRFNNNTPNIANSEIVVTHSECIGLVPDSSSTIVFNGVGNPGNYDYAYLSNTMINCDFWYIGSFNNNSACKNTRFIGCRFGSDINAPVYNVTQSWVASVLQEIYAGPASTSFDARDHGFNYSWTDF